MASPWRMADMWTRLLALFSRLGFVWARRRLDHETQDEFNTHLDLLAIAVPAYRATRRDLARTLRLD